MPTPRAVSFDFDNTLLLSEHTKFQTMREVVAPYEGGLAVLETVPHDSRTAPAGVKVTRYSIFEGVARGLIERGSAPSEETDAVTFGAKMCDTFSTVLQGRLLTAQEVPGATALLAHLTAHGVPCYVNTATPQEPIDELIDALGWRPRFRKVLGAPGTKVENLMAVSTAEGLVAPAELVHVGDGDNDCKAARDFGCPFIGIALDAALGGSGAPGGGFSAPCHVHKSPATTSHPFCRSKQSFTLNGGSGTHIDAPAHFVAGGRTVDGLGTEELAARPLAVISVPLAVVAAAAAGEDVCVGLEVILADEALHGQVPYGAFVCIRTGWAADRYADASRYLNAPDTARIDPSIGLPRMAYPGVSEAAASFLISARGAVGLGVDTLSPDGGDGAARGFPVHHVVLGADRYIVENLNLGPELPPRGALVFVAPLNVAGAPEAPARVWAMLP